MDGIPSILAEHWYLLLGGWYVWRWLESEKRQRREDERIARTEQREATREVVREELAAHVKEEAAEVGRFRDDVRRELAGVADLVRQHEQRLADLERR